MELGSLLKTSTYLLVHVFFIVIFTSTLNQGVKFVFKCHELSVYHIQLFYGYCWKALEISALSMVVMSNSKLYWHNHEHLKVG